jgi:hypothetical protein
MEYLYFLANASLTLRLVKYLHAMPQLPVKFMTVIHLLDGWVVKVKMNSTLNPQQDGDFQAFLNELGIPLEPQPRINMALMSLEAGQPLSDVMRRYQVVVVSHGSPECSEIEAFRHQLTEGLGYCPETLG